MPPTLPAPPALAPFIEPLQAARELLHAAIQAREPAAFLRGAAALLAPVDLAEAHDARDLLMQAGSSPAAGALLRGALAILDGVLSELRASSQARRRSATA